MRYIHLTCFEVSISSTYKWDTASQGETLHCSLNASPIIYLTMHLRLAIVWKIDHLLVQKLI